jgi:hypothetical protein
LGTISKVVLSAEFESGCPQNKMFSQFFYVLTSDNGWSLCRRWLWNLKSMFMVVIHYCQFELLQHGRTVICSLNLGIHVVLVLCNFVLHDFALLHLEHLNHFLNLRDNYRFSAIWHSRSVVTLIFCRRLAGSDVTVSPSVTCVDWYVGYITMLII